MKDFTIHSFTYYFDELSKILCFFQFDSQIYFPGDVVLIEDQLIFISYKKMGLKEEGLKEERLK